MSRTVAGRPAGVGRGTGWRGSWRLGRVAGIPVRLHWSVTLLALWVLAPALAHPATWLLEAAYAAALLAALIGCVVLHELGHSLAARQLGVGVRDITLLPFGGMARLEVTPGRGAPGDATAIALAGPAVSGALSLLLLPLAWIASGAGQVGPAALLRAWGQPGLAGFLTTLWLANLLLAGLNLLPVMPLDGGRALRAALAPAVGERAALRLGASLGVLLAIIGGAIGLWLAQWWLAAPAALLGAVAARQLATGR
jgi:Zn-dependent protease